MMERNHYIRLQSYRLWRLYRIPHHKAVAMLLPLSPEGRKGLMRKLFASRGKAAA